MSKILDNINETSVNQYIAEELAGLEFSDEANAKVHSILSFLEWAYEKDYISFFKYQQTSDLIDNALHNGLIEKPKPQVLVIPKHVDPTPKKTSPFIQHAYVFLPLITGALVLLLYIYVSSTSQTISPVNITSLQQGSSARRNSGQAYILSYQDQVADEFGIPLNSDTALRFRLYQGPNSTSAVYDSSDAGECMVKPLIDGSVQVDIGRVCGQPIPGSIFSPQTQLWLGVTVGTAPEAQPRKSVNLTAQGLRIDTSVAQNQTGTLSDDLLADPGNSTSGADRIIQATDSAHIRLLTGGTQAIDIAETGFVGINKDNPGYNLDVLGDVNVDGGQLTISDEQKDTSTVQIHNTDKSETADGVDVKLGFEGNGSGGNNFVTFRNGNSKVQGKIQSNQNGGVSYATSGSDFAEYFRRDLTTSYNEESYTAGSLMCHSFEGVSPCNTSSKYIIGAVSDNPGFIGGITENTSPEYILVGLVGQLKVKIYNDGTIKRGDALTFSTYPGYASKAYQKGSIVGYAQETPSTKGFTSILTHIQPSYFDPIVYSGLSEQSNPPYLAQVSQRFQTLVADLIQATSAKIDTLIARNISTDTLSVKTIESPQIEKIEQDVAKVTDQAKIETYIADEAGSASAKETLSTTIQTDSTDAGEGTIPVGQKTVTIFNKNVHARTLVYLTNTSTTQNRTIYIAEKRGCSGENVEQSSEKSSCQPYFKVSIDKPLDSNISFNWWIVNE